MTTVAFVGLGIMGAPMAGHLVDAGFDVVGVNRSPEKVQELVERGGRGADNIAEAARDADVVAVMVPDSPDVQEVLAGDGGVFDTAKPGTLVIDFSSIRPDVTAQLAAQAKEKGLRILDAPVSGGAGAAEAATLSIMVGGEEARLRRPRARPRRRRQDDRPRRPERVRADRQGRQPAHRRRQHPAARRGRRVPRGVRRRHQGRAHGPRWRPRRQQGPRPEGREHAARSFQPGFRIELHHKDLGIVTSAAREAGVVIPLGAVVAQLMAAAKPTATAAWTTRRCCAACCACPAETD